MRARLLRFHVQIPALEFGMQIPELLVQHRYHAHFKAHTLHKTVAPAVMMLE